MNIDYADIIERAGEPLWWDENAVPRYVPFHPKHCDVYAEEAILLEIECQACGTRFTVAMARSRSRATIRAALGLPVDDSDWSKDPPHYGDPPYTDCCPAGPTMNVDFIRVIKHWRRDRALDWHHVQAIASTHSTEDR